MMEEFMTKRFYYSIHQRLKGLYIFCIIGFCVNFLLILAGRMNIQLQPILKIGVIFLLVGMMDTLLRFLWALPWYIQIENGQLQFVYLLKRTSIPLTEVLSIRVKKNEIEKFEKLLTIVVLEMKNGRKMEFNGAIAQGYQMLVDAIQKEKERDER